MSNDINKTNGQTTVISVNNNWYAYKQCWIDKNCVVIWLLGI